MVEAYAEDAAPAREGDHLPAVIGDRQEDGAVGGLGELSLKALAGPLVDVDLGVPRGEADGDLEVARVGDADDRGGDPRQEGLSTPRIPANGGLSERECGLSHHLKPLTDDRACLARAGLARCPSAYPGGRTLSRERL